MRAFYVLALVAVAAASYGDNGRENPNSGAVRKDSFFCIPCILGAKIIRIYMRPFATLTDLFCMAFNLGGPCGGTAKMFLGALEVGGERHACSLIKLCSGDVSPLEIPSGLRPITNGIENAAESVSNFTRNSLDGARTLFGDTIKQTASGLGNLISGSSNFAGKLASNLPVLGGSLENLIGSTGNFFGGMSESIGNGIGDIFNQAFPHRSNRRKRSTSEWTAKAILDRLDVNLPRDASEVAKGFKYLAEQIKEKTLEKVRKEEELAKATTRKPTYVP
ncbi:hypothetical protein ANCCEY_13387 [Ancylostoma ceylanicum]|uniref:Chondroitin proteoglycan 4 domain-containing protein n=1 Tax=Ancylostoma ceylanicum TaxID=53326 RepID=A0A0D6L7M6_9BILA|nr:hypothetical protein ANCCEY_13387 [Ancylostoma ceylanicum]